MPGTKMGGQKAAATNKRLYGRNFYKRIGKLGGLVSGPGGFGSDIEFARACGRKGGLVSKRRKKELTK